MVGKSFVGADQKQRVHWRRPDEPSRGETANRRHWKLLDKREIPWRGVNEEGRDNNTS